MTQEDFESSCEHFLAPNELEYFNTLKDKVPEDKRVVFSDLILHQNTVLASFRAMDIVHFLAKQSNIKPGQVLTNLPMYIRLYCTLKINKIQLSCIKPLPGEYSEESLFEKSIEMMEDIR